MSPCLNPRTRLLIATRGSEEAECSPPVTAWADGEELASNRRTASHSWPSSAYRHCTQRTALAGSAGERGEAGKQWHVNVPALFHGHFSYLCRNVESDTYLLSGLPPVVLKLNRTVYFLVWRATYVPRWQRRRHALDGAGQSGGEWRCKNERCTVT